MYVGDIESGFTYLMQFRGRHSHGMIKACMYMRTSVPEVSISSMAELLHPTEYCGMQLLSLAWATCFYHQGPLISQVLIWLLSGIWNNQLLVMTLSCTWMTFTRYVYFCTEIWLMSFKARWQSHDAIKVCVMDSNAIMLAGWCQING